MSLLCIDRCEKKLFPGAKYGIITVAVKYQRDRGRADGDGRGPGGRSSVSNKKAY